MSKIYVEYDTVSKALRVSMDSKELKNVERISAFKFYTDDEGKDAWGVDIESYEMDKDNKTWTSTRISASKNDQPKIESYPISEHIAKNLFGQK